MTNKKPSVQFWLENHPAQHLAGTQNNHDIDKNQNQDTPIGAKSHENLPPPPPHGDFKTLTQVLSYPVAYYRIVSLRCVTLHWNMRMPRSWTLNKDIITIPVATVARNSITEIWKPITKIWKKDNVCHILLPQPGVTAPLTL